MLLLMGVSVDPARPQYKCRIGSSKTQISGHCRKNNKPNAIKWHTILFSLKQIEGQYDYTESIQFNYNTNIHTLYYKMSVTLKDV